MDSIGVPYRPAAIPGDGAQTYSVVVNHLDYRGIIIEQVVLGPFGTFTEAAGKRDRIASGHVSAEIVAG